MNKILKRIKLLKFNFKKYGFVCNQYLSFMLHIWFKLLGLSPWKMDTKLRVNPKTENKSSRFYFSYGGSCYNILIFTFIIALVFYFLRNIFSKYANDFNFTLEVISVSLVLFSMMCTSVILLTYIFRQKLLINVFNRFKNLDEKLNKCADYKMENDNINYLIFSIYIVMM